MFILVSKTTVIVFLKTNTHIERERKLIHVIIVRVSPLPFRFA